MSESARTITAILHRCCELFDTGDFDAFAAQFAGVQAAPNFPMQPVFGGRYKDRFERVDGVWVWRERKVISDLRGDTSRHVRASRE